MMSIKKYFLILLLPLIFSCNKLKDSFEAIVPSPDSKIHVYFNLNKGEPYYLVYYKKEIVIGWSSLGFILKDNDSLIDGFVVTARKTRSVNETGDTVLGEIFSFNNKYNELVISLQEKDVLGRKFDIVFRVFNNGIGFRYVFPEQEGLTKVEIVSEETEFKLGSDGIAWWIPADSIGDEHLYRSTSVKEIEMVNTPVTFDLKNGLCVSIHETNLTDYARMTLKRDKEDELEFDCYLVPFSDGIKVKTKTPFKTPWRIIQIMNDPEKPVESGLMQ